MKIKDPSKAFTPKILPTGAIVIAWLVLVVGGCTEKSEAEAPNPALVDAWQPPDSSNPALDASPSDASGAPQWAQSGNGPSKAGRASYKGPRAQKVKWIYELDGGWGSEIVVAHDGSVYFTRSLEGEKTKLIALDAAGSPRWQREADAFSHPVLGADGTVFVIRREGERSEVVALDGDGAELWHASVEGDPTTALVIGDRGDLYFATQRGDGEFFARKTELYAFDAQGQALWKVTLSEVGYPSTPAIDGETIYVGGDELRALRRADGSSKWSVPVATLGGVLGPAVGPDGTIYVAGTDWDLTTTKTFYAFNADGTERWRKTTGIVEMTPAVAADGTVYFHAWPHADASALSSGLFAFAPNGEMRWALKDIWLQDMSDPDVSSPFSGSDSSPVVDAEGMIYMGSDTGELTAVKPDGTLLWKMRLYFELDNRPSLGADGSLYLCNAGGPGHTKCFALADSGAYDLPADPWNGYPCQAEGQAEGHDGEICSDETMCSGGQWVKECCVGGVCRDGAR